MALGFLLSFKIYKHEKWQSEQIHILQADNVNLYNQITSLQNEVNKLHGIKEYSDDAFNYLAIGNSITVHRVLDYWWNESGMAASAPQNDYVHLVANGIKEIYGNVCFYAVNYFSWEEQAYDRAETYEVITPYLSPKLNLVTIQLGENIRDTNTLNSDLEALIKYIQQEAPNAEIILIDDFWYNQVNEQIKKDVAQKMGVQFISLDEIKGDPEYQCGVGSVIYDAEGGQHVVEHEGVAVHPGDKGMSYIAEAIIETIK